MDKTRNGAGETVATGMGDEGWIVGNVSLLLLYGGRRCAGAAKLETSVPER